MTRLLAVIAVLITSPALAIVGGETDSGDEAVVAITLGDFTVCSGVLIAQDVVLTAGHCLPPLGSAEVRFGADITHPTLRAKISDQLTHPQFTKEGAPFDFALIHLQSPVAVTPLALSTAVPSVGQTVVHIGFGVSDEAAGTGRGLKRRATYPVTQVQPEVFYSGASGLQTCDGDSGGPALDDGGNILGIVSDGPNCHDDGWDGRIDLAAGWISDQLHVWAPPGPEPTPAPKGGCGGTGLVLAVLALAAIRPRF